MENPPLVPVPEPESVDPVLPWRASRSDPAVRWWGVLPPDLVEGLAARPDAARAFDRMSLSDIRETVRYIDAAGTDSLRRHRLRRLLAGLARVPGRARSA